MVNLYLTDKLGRATGATMTAPLNPNFRKEDVMVWDKDGNDTDKILYPKHDPADKYHYDPRVSSLEQPPECGAFECAVIKMGKWKKVVDKVGKKYYLADGTPKTIPIPDMDVPEGCLEDPPPSPFHDSHDGKVWVENVDKKKESERIAASGFAGATVDQITEQINILFDSVNTIAGLKESCKDILIKIIEEMHKGR